MSPPLQGPNITIQRPSISTPVHQPKNKFPGNPTNPFIQSARGDWENRGGNSSGDASPGARPGEASRSPAPPNSRAAQSYTPPPQPTPQPMPFNEPERSLSAQSNPQANDQQQNREIPVVSDTPSPAPNQSRNVIPEDPRVTVFRQAAYAAPTPTHQSPFQARDESVGTGIRNPSPVQPPNAQVPNPRVTAMKNAAYAAPSSSPRPQEGEVDRTPTPTPQNQSSQPEMQQTNRRGTSFVPPFMPSPDIRPPSDDSLPTPMTAQRIAYTNQNDSASSMPIMFIPEEPSPNLHPHAPPTSQPQPERRERDRSQSVPRSGPIPATESELTSKPGSPVSQLSHRKSVSFAAKPEYSEAPPPAPRHRDQPSYDSDPENADSSRRRRHERDGERDRDQHRHKRDRERRGYDAGDDLSDDTPSDDRRRRSHDREGRGPRHSSRRERSNTQSLDREQDRDRYRDPKRSNTMGGSSSSSSRRHRDPSPTGSDETVDLPDRFDDRGRRKPGSYGEGARSKDQDLIADSLDQILGGLFGGSSSSHSKKR